MCLSQTFIYYITDQEVNESILVKRAFLVAFPSSRSLATLATSSSDATSVGKIFSMPAGQWHPIAYGRMRSHASRHDKIFSMLALSPFLEKLATFLSIAAKIL